MKKILLIGNGSREHALAEAFKKNRDVSLVVYAKSVNPGIQALADAYEIGDLMDLAHVRAFAVAQKVDFAFCGPEDPIAAGMADELEKASIRSCFPKKLPAQLESSKAFTRNLVTKYAIPGNPLFQVFTGENSVAMQQVMEAFVQKVSGNFVVKADSLRGGKGVKVSGDHFITSQEGLAYARECVAEDGRVVLEEKFIGQEFSLMSFCDGKTAVHMPAIQDHKRALNGDKGPNTGGMGTYCDANSSLPFLTPGDLEAAGKINQQVLDAVFQETGVPFCGILYGGFIALKNGVGLIEYNVRFGDPEVMNALSVLETDFVSVCEAMMHGTLDQLPLSFAKKATVCKYVVPDGYPDAPVKDVPVTVGSLPDGAQLYYGSVDLKDGELLLCGSRAIAVLGSGTTLEKAQEVAEKGACAITGPVFHRSDVGTSALIDHRVQMMHQIRA